MNSYIHNFKDVEHVLSDNSIIFDIGLNVGFFSKLICCSKKYSKIYGFEPVTEYFFEAKRNLSKYKNVSIYNTGFGNKNENLPIYIAGKSHKGWNTFLEKDPNQSADFYKKMNKQYVDVITLDDFCEENNITKIDLIKIDVEGFECKVLEGGLKTLEKLESKPYLYIEVGWGKTHPDWNYCENIYNKLFEIGYKPVEFTDETKDILFEPLK